MVSLAQGVKQVEEDLVANLEKQEVQEQVTLEEPEEEQEVQEQQDRQMVDLEEQDMDIAMDIKIKIIQVRQE